MMITKKEFLSHISNYELHCSIDVASFIVCGNDKQFISFIDTVFLKDIVTLWQYYTNIETLFAIFAINYWDADKKLLTNYTNSCNNSVYPIVEWQIISGHTEIDSHFSYQIIGDGSFFDQPIAKQGMLVTSTKATCNVLMFINTKEHTITIPVLNIPVCFKQNLGVYCVQESEATIINPSSIKSSGPLITQPLLLFVHAAASISDCRKQDSIIEQSIIYDGYSAKSNLPVLCIPFCGEGNGKCNS